MDPKKNALSRDGTAAAILKTSLAARKKRWGKAPAKERNPLLTIWFHPGFTMRKLLREDPRRYVLPLGALHGICLFLSFAFDLVPSEAISETMIYLAAVAAGPFLGILVLYVAGWLIGGIGRMLDGRGTNEAARTAWAWSQIIHLPRMILALGISVIISRLGPVDMDILNTIFLVILISHLVLWVWSIVLAFACISEIHKVTVLRALITLVVSELVIYFPFYTIGMWLA